MQNLLDITENMKIPMRELRFTYSRSGKPGGQNVNKVNTRVTLSFNLAESPSLSGSQKELLARKLKPRIDSNGILCIVSQEHRTQLANKRAAIDRFVELLRQSLHRPPARIKTRKPVSADLRRLESKRKRGTQKKLREKIRDVSD